MSIKRAIVLPALWLCACGGGSGGEANQAASGSYAYVADGDSNSVAVYSVLGNGALSPLAEGPYAVAPGAAAMALDPADKHLFVASQGKVSVFGVAADGALTAAPASPYNADAVSLAVDPTGKFLYTAASGINGFTIAADGELAPMANNPVYICNCDAVAIDPSGPYLYSPSYQANQPGNPPAFINGFKIGTDGTLTPVPGNPYTPPSGASGSYAYSNSVIALSATLPFAFVNDSDNDLYVLGIGSGGAVQQVQSFSEGSGVEQATVAVHPNGRVLYALQGYVPLAAFSIGTDGALTPLGKTVALSDLYFPGTPAFPGEFRLTVAPAGNAIYVAIGSNNINAFALNSDGSIGGPIPGSPFTVGSHAAVMDIAITPRP